MTSDVLDCASFAAALILAICSGTNFFEAVNVGVEIFGSAVDLLVGAEVGLSVGRDVVVLRLFGEPRRLLSSGFWRCGIFS